jgi:hypothetical protein
MVGLFVLLAGLTMLLALPPVQTFIAQKVVNYLNKDFDIDIQIKQIELHFSREVAIKGVLIRDHKQDTLIAAKTLTTSLDNLRQLKEGNLFFGKVIAEELFFQMKTHKGDTLSNLDIFVSKFDSDEPSTGSFLMKVPTVKLHNTRCYFIDENNAEPMLLKIDQLNGKVADFQIQGSNVSLQLEDANFWYNNQLKVDKMNADRFAYTDTLMRADHLYLRADANPYTSLLADLKMYPHKGSYGNFLNKVVFDATLHSAQLNTTHLNTFYNGFTPERVIKMEAVQMKGTLNNFTLPQGEITYQNTLLNGYFAFKNLFSDDADIIVRGKRVYAESIYNDLALLMPTVLGENIPKELQRLKMFTLQGDFDYRTTSLDVNMRLKANEGEAEIVGDLTDLTHTEKTFFKGTLKTLAFPLGSLLADPSLGTMTADLTVRGNGFDPQTMQLFANGTFHSIGYNGYQYQKIKVNGAFRNQVFNGEIDARDPNLTMRFSGLADLSQHSNKFDFQADIAIADFHALKLIDIDTLSQFCGKVIIDIEGNQLDDIEGKIAFKNTNYINSAGDFTFKDFEIYSSVDDQGVKEISINSPDIVSGNVKGKFKMAEMKKMLQNAVGSIYTHYNPYQIEHNQYVDFHFDIYNKIVEVFVPEVKISRNTFINGNIDADRGSFKFQVKSPQVDVYNNRIDSLSLEIDNKNPLYNTFLEVKKVDLGVYTLQDLNLINTTIKDTLFFRTEFKGGETGKDNYELNFYHTLNKKQESIIGIKKSLVNFKGNAWFINRENAMNDYNKIVLNRTADSIRVSNFKMAHQNQYVNLSGLITTADYKNLHLVAHNVALEKIVPEMKGLNLTGTLNGNVSLTQKGNLYYPSADLFIKYFKLNGYDYGDLEMAVFGNNDLSSFDVGAFFSNGRTRGFATRGKIHLDKKKGTLLDLNAHFDEFALSPFNPFLEGIFDHLRGTMSGDVKISGPIADPLMDGMLTLHNAGVNVSYLNLNANVQEGARIKVNNKTFDIDNWELTDTAYKTQATLSGSIRHNHLLDWFLDLKLQTLGKRFMVLNTPYTDDALFYGTAFMKGRATIKGALDEIAIKVNAQSEEGTSFKIPLSDTESVGDDSFITFIEKGDKKVKVTRELESIKGLELNFELDILPTAEVEIVMDKKTGSNLVGRGAGTLLIEINTNGKFNMWGDFITYSGFYNFKYENFIDKRFTVLPGGSISWSGDPLTATLRDLKAAYTLSANPSTLLESMQYNRKINTQVLIKLQGELMHPETVFDITFPDSSPSLVSELNYKLEDQDRKQLQAFSLLAQGSFMSEKNTDNRLVAYNLFETAAGLFNQLLSDEDNKLNLGVSYEAGINDGHSDINSDRLGFTVSTQITDWASVNAKVGIPVGGVSRTAVAGNVEVQFRLNPDGSLIAKIFNRENEWQQYMLDRIGYAQGVGLTYSVDFNTFKGLMQKIFKKGGNVLEEKHNK